MKWLVGTETIWSNWDDIKDHIKPHIPQSIEKYNFPTDDISFIYGVVIEKMKQQQTLPSNAQLEAIGIGSVVESYITNPALRNL